MNGEILTLNKSINRFHAASVNKIRDIAVELISDKYKDGGRRG